MAMAKDVTVIILDVGENAAERETKNSPMFFEQEKECVEKILLRKIFTKPKDEVSLLLMGTPSTDNELNEELDGYEHITNGFPMAPINWSMLNYVQRSIDPPNDGITADWLDAIIVAMNYLKTLAIPKSNLKIILFTTFSTIVNNENMATVASGLEQLGIELIAITTNVIYQVDANTQMEYPTFSQGAAKSLTRKKSEQLIDHIIRQTNGNLISFNDAIPKLIYFDKKQRRRVPWNCDLQIGNSLQIKIAAYIFVREEKELGGWKFRAANGVKCQRKIEYYHGDELIDPETLADNLIKGFMYAQTAVPFEDADNYDNGGKGFRCIGFTDAGKIQDEYLAGTGVWAVVPQKNFTVAAKMMAALTMAMRESNLAMIVRYTYNNRSLPKMMVLFPNTLNKEYPYHNSLLMYELFYKENFVKIQFPALKKAKTQPTPEQYDAVDKFIDAMDLMQATDDDDDDDDLAIDTNAKDAPKKSTEAFKKLLNPAQQHLYRAIAHRALNPSAAALKADKDLLDMLNAPKKLQIDAKPHFDKIKELFELKVVKKSTKSAFFEKLQQISTQADAENSNNTLDNDGNVDLIEIGTVTPAEDFATLLKRGESFITLVNQIQNIISSLILRSVVLPEEKVIKAILVYREEAKLKGAFRYNEWITELKAILMQCGKADLWQTLFIREGFGLITATESEMSTVTDAEANAFYTSGTGNESNRADDTVVEEEEDVEDMFNEM